MRAPSGDNVQPWRFVLSDRTLEIFNVPGRDTSLYNVGQVASLIAHGTLLESIAICAPGAGLAVTDTEIPAVHDGRAPVARMSFEPTAPQRHELDPCIEQRCTNRKPYERTPLTTDEVAQVTRDTHVPDVAVHCTTNQQEVAAVAQAACANERIVLENEHLHRFLFANVRWSDEHARETGDGFHIGTFELRPPEQAVFAAIRRWPVNRVARLAGIPRIVSNANAQRYVASGAMLAITRQAASPRTWVSAGRVLQRVWLSATAAGLSLQPLAGIALLAERLRRRDTDVLTARHQRLIRDANGQLGTTFRTGQAPFAMVVRIGRASTPSARTQRRAPDIAEHPTT